jgi:hypothetical protein
MAMLSGVHMYSGNMEKSFGVCITFTPSILISEEFFKAERRYYTAIFGEFDPRHVMRYYCVYD